MLFRDALARADRMYLTHIDAEVEGDAFFPAFDPADWVVVEENFHPADDRHAFAFTFRRYDRRAR